MEKKEEYLSIKEVCEELSISHATLKNWIKLEKIYPDKIDDNKEYLFAPNRILALKQSISNGTNVALKSRRNKTYVSGNSIYKSYLSENSNNISVIQNLLDVINSQNIYVSDETIRLLVAECAIQLYVQRKSSKAFGTNLLYRFLTKELILDKFAPFIEDLIIDKSSVLEFIESNQKLFNIEYTYEFGEDILGLLYLSTKNIGKRKASGAYYTPTKIVKRLVNSLFINKTFDVADIKIFDPCCGTGNFLLQLPKNYTLENIYANDIDTISVKITRINLALHFECYDYKLLAEHVTNNDYLHYGDDYEYDYIIGNPPWGYKFSADEQKFLRNHFQTAQGKNIESFDVVIEQALKNLKKDGFLSFVVPESILNVKTHTMMRKILANCTEIQYLEYLGNAFDSVQCPAIILQLKNTKREMSAYGLKVKDSTREFVVETKRKISPDCFAFKIDDEEYRLITKLSNLKNQATLYDNSIFALGIVTGNNADYLEHKKQKSNEVILKGSDIFKYAIKPSDNFISYQPEKFQQVAPTEYYRAKEKLFYRFICNRLVFAYDNSQMLSLNSCNILIPQISGLDIKYIMAVLNSRVTQFIYSKIFNSIKILRSHLEQLPIPVVDTKKQQEIIKLVDKLLLEDLEQNRSVLYSQIEEKMFEIFSLDEKEREIIIKGTEVSNNFLY